MLAFWSLSRTQSLQNLLPSYVPNLSMTIQNALVSHAHVPIVLDLKMYFTRAAKVNSQIQVWTFFTRSQTGSTSARFFTPYSLFLHHTLYTFLIPLLLSSSPNQILLHSKSGHPHLCHYSTLQSLLLRYLLHFLHAQLFYPIFSINLTLHPSNICSLFSPP